MYQHLKRDELLSNHSTFRIGGPARYFIEVRDQAHMQDLMRFVYREHLPWFILGRGSNILFLDEGFDGLVILNKIDFFLREEELIHVGGGASFAHLGMHTAKQGLSGLEFAAGIPGSVGGAVYMNAGAGKDETKDRLFFVDVLDEKGNCHRLMGKDLSFSYRHSSLQERKSIVVGAGFSLTTDSGARDRQKALLQYRIERQPYNERSCGCIFKNPKQGMSAGALIEQSGLKGVGIGGAEVSVLHANFIVNRGEAKAKDVLELMHLVQSHVHRNCGIYLEPEIRVFSG